jgi:hypothetical protein
MEEEVALELFKRFAKPGETMDDDWIEAIEETIVEEGELVASHSWNSGGPGIGAGLTFVYRFRGPFFSLQLTLGLEGLTTVLRRQQKMSGFSRLQMQQRAFG